MRRTIIVAIAAATAALLGACGTLEAASDGADTTVEARHSTDESPQERPEPYEGPMKLPQDFSDDATALERSGASGRALECDTAPYGGGAGDYKDGPAELRDAPKKALRNGLTNVAFGVPQTGYRVERDTGKRVLFSYDIDGRTKVAFIAKMGIPDGRGHQGWGIESWAMCDPSELPASVNKAHDIGVWKDSSGDPVPVTRVRSSHGSQRCGWEDATFLYFWPDRALGKGQIAWNDAEQYVRNPHGGVPTELRTTTYETDVDLPGDATDTGFHRNGRELWLVPDRTAAYLVNLEDNDDVERWPATTQDLSCY